MPESARLVEESRPKRGSWSKLCSFAIVRIVVGLVVVVVILSAFQFGFPAAAAASPSLKHFFDVTFLPAWVGVVAALFAYSLFVRWIERRRAAELGRRG